MKHSYMQYKASALRQEKIIFAIEAILIYIVALFTSAMLPAILVQYVLKSSNPFEQPRFLEYIPVAAFTIATLYFLYATVQIIRRANEVKRLDAEMLMMGHDDCCCGHCEMDELSELESMAEKEVSSATKRKSVKRKSSKKSNKK